MIAENAIAVRALRNACVFEQYMVYFFQTFS